MPKLKFQSLNMRGLRNGVRANAVCAMKMHTHNRENCLDRDFGRLKPIQAMAAVGHQLSATHAHCQRDKADRRCIEFKRSTENLGLTCHEAPAAEFADLVQTDEERVAAVPFVLTRLAESAGGIVFQISIHGKALF
jgi:hypothetical protein